MQQKGRQMIKGTPVNPAQLLARRAAPQAVIRAAKAGGDLPLPDMNGMVLLEYVGRNVGRSVWWGPATHGRYMVSKAKPVVYVDQADAERMLEIMQGRRPVFRIYRQAAPTPIVAPAPQPKPAVVAAPATVVEAAPAPQPKPAVVAAPATVVEAAPAPVAAAVTEAASLTDKPKRKRRTKKDQEAGSGD